MQIITARMYLNITVNNCTLIKIKLALHAIGR